MTPATSGSTAVSMGAAADHAACDAEMARFRARAEAAEGKLARLRSVLLEGGQDATTARRRALAIIGSEESVRGGSYDVWGADFGVVGGKA